MSLRVRFKTTIMTAQTALNTLSSELSPATIASVEYVAFYVVFSAGSAAGAVQIESAHLSGYSGVWAAEGSPVAWAVASSVKKATVTGPSYALRARISTAITTGTVDVIAVGLG